MAKMSGMTVSHLDMVLTHNYIETPWIPGYHSYASMQDSAVLNGVQDSDFTSLSDSTLMTWTQDFGIASLDAFMRARILGM